MAKFRKNPVVIEAVRYGWPATGWGSSAEFMEVVCNGVANCPTGPDDPHIHTLEGAMIVRDGDWIIKGVKGEFYPCKPDIFAATYEAAE